MKHFCLSVLLLFSASLFAQKFDCVIPNKLIKPTDKFEKISTVYADYLSQVIGDMDSRGLTNKVIQNLNPLGACYFTKISKTKEGLLYAIPDDMITDAPALLLMLLTSKAIDKPEDKQSWLTLYPIMDDKQKNKLWDILWREKTKVAEIEEKYLAEKRTIKESFLDKQKEIAGKYDNKFSRQIFGICEFSGRDEAVTYGVWEKKEDGYHLKDSKTICDDIQEITPLNIDKTLKNNASNIRYDLKGKFDEYKVDYIDYLSGITNKEFAGFQNLAYHIEFLDGILDEDHRNPAKIFEAEQLLRLDFDELAQEDSLDFSDSEKEQFKYSKLAYLQSVNDELHKYKIACESKVKMIGMGKMGSRGVFFNCYYSLKYQNDTSCVACLSQLDTSINQYFDKNKSVFIQDMKQFREFQTQFLMWDFFEKYTKNKTLKTHIQNVNPQIKPLFSVKTKDIFSNDYQLQEWYYELTHRYITGEFKPSYTLQQLESQFNNMESVKHLVPTPKDDQTDKVSAKAEFLAYYCLWQLVYNEASCNKENIRVILEQSLTICNNPSSKAYGYLEKTMVNTLLKSIAEPKISDTQKPEIEIHPDMIKFQIGGRWVVNNSKEVEMKFNIRDYSNLKSLLLFVNNIEVEIFESEKSKINSTTTFGVKHNLNVGKNEVKIVATDEFDNTSATVFAIDVSDIPIKRAKFYALMIGINQYKNDSWKLRTCVKDCKDIAQILSTKYGFVVDTLFDDQATGKGIKRKLNALGAKADLDSNSNVLIYYSGHGETKNEVAYWVPSDTEDETDWISTSEIKDQIDVISKKARHTLLMIDACYSGVIFNQSKGANDLITSNEEEYYKAKSVHGLASGGNRQVPAQSGICGNGSSPFSCALQKALGQNSNLYLPTANIATQIRSQLSNDTQAQAAGQTPIYTTLGSGGALGEFIFINQNAAQKQPQVARTTLTSSHSKSTQVAKQSLLINTNKIITASKSRICSSPNANTLTEMYVIKGDEVKILDVQGVWLQIRYHNHKKNTNISGWVLANDLE